MVYVKEIKKKITWPHTFPESVATTASESLTLVTTFGMSFSLKRGTLCGVAPSTERTGDASGAGVDDNPCLVLLGVLE